jgi:hypothetical protein
MSNPWSIKLKKTGFLEKHLESEEASISELEVKQVELRSAAIVNNLKLEEYKKRISSIVVDTMSGQQGKLSNLK